MDRHKHEELSDELLEREIETALDVEPSPEFLARVRTRIASESVDESGAWVSAGRWAGAALAMVAVVVVGLWIAREPASAPAQRPLTTAPRDVAPLVVPQPSILKPESAAPGAIASSNVSKPVVSVRPAGVEEPAPANAELLISQDEAAALRRLFTAISNGRLDAAVLPDLDAALQPPSEIEEIVLEPITLSPLVSLESE